MGVIYFVDAHQRQACKVGAWMRTLAFGLTMMEAFRFPFLTRFIEFRRLLNRAQCGGKVHFKDKSALDLPPVNRLRGYGSCVSDIRDLQSAFCSVLL